MTSSQMQHLSLFLLVHWEENETTSLGMLWLLGHKIKTDQSSLRCLRPNETLDRSNTKLNIPAGVWKMSWKNHKSSWAVPCVCEYPASSDFNHFITSRCGIAYCALVTQENNGFITTPCGSNAASCVYPRHTIFTLLNFQPGDFGKKINELGKNKV